MREQPASVINTRQTSCHISMPDPGLRKEWSSVYGLWDRAPGASALVSALKQRRWVRRPRSPAVWQGKLGEQRGESRRLAGRGGWGGQARCIGEGCGDRALRLADGSLPFKTQK